MILQDIIGNYYKISLSHVCVCISMHWHNEKEIFSKHLCYFFPFLWHQSSLPSQTCYFVFFSVNGVTSTFILLLNIMAYVLTIKLDYSTNYLLWRKKFGPLLIINRLLDISIALLRFLLRPFMTLVTKMSLIMSINYGSWLISLS